MYSKSRILASVAATLGISCQVFAVTPVSVGMEFKGYVTMLAPTGEAVQNTSFVDEPRFLGHRTPINGRMVMNFTHAGMVGGATFDPFLFIESMARGRDITFVPVDAFFGTPVPSSTLLVGNMAFDYGTNVGIPVSIVLDMGNLNTALLTAKVGDVITGVLRSASDNTVFYMEDDSERVMPIGPVVVATTTWDTTDLDTDGDGQPGPIARHTNPSGTVPLRIDSRIDETNGDTGIGGSPIKAVAFRNFNPNFDITEITVTCVGALGDCDVAGISVPALPLSPQPLEPVQDQVGGLVRGLGL